MLLLFDTLFACICILFYHNFPTNTFRHKGNFICESDVSYVRPGWAKNWKGEWIAVLNTDVFPQSVRIETCK